MTQPFTVPVSAQPQRYGYTAQFAPAAQQAQPQFVMPSPYAPTPFAQTSFVPSMQPLAFPQMYVPLPTTMPQAQTFAPQPTVMQTQTFIPQP
ncbi:MAG: hypothetical protein ACRC1U_10295, partial [Vibrionaceae bacterium]